MIKDYLGFGHLGCCIRIG